MAETHPPGRLLGPLFVPPPRVPFATDPAASQGRFHPEPESPTRTCYQRDRDRIVHSAAFRRLKHKTQVFVQHEGDYYRTRLTHSLEVAQIARSVARILGFDEDLAEALALSHDLGHPPFGHAGEQALNACMKGFGGFDHNAQALALVTRLEHRYAAFDGLNLTWETLEGLVKHNGPLVHAGRDRSHLSPVIAEFDALWNLELQGQAGPEAQAAALSDDIAYVNHDIDDGLRAGLFAIEDLYGVAVIGPIAQEVQEQKPGLELGRVIGESVRRLITFLLEDVIGETKRRIVAAKPANVQDVRRGHHGLVSFSRQGSRDLAELKAFLYQSMYRHPRVMQVMTNAQLLVTELFEAFMRDPALLPPDWTKLCGMPNDSATARAASDYIGGMTDNFAEQEYRRVFHMEFPL